LADALRRLIEAKIPLDGAADHGVSEACAATCPAADPNKARRRCRRDRK
jgi:hypothetical protein